MVIVYMRGCNPDKRQSVDPQRDGLMAVGVDERHIHRIPVTGTA